MIQNDEFYKNTHKVTENVKILSRKWKNVVQKEIKENKWTKFLRFISSSRRFSDQKLFN